MKISIDSRTVEPGDYFIPVQGKNFDGRDFIPEVLAKGGHVLDVDLHAYTKKYRRSLTARVIAIVGSAGKTTVKDMLDGVLSQAYQVVKTQQNQNNEFGVPLTLLAADEDTEIVIVEMGLRKPDDLMFLAKLVQPDVVVFTGVGHSHMAFFDRHLQLVNAKAAIFRKSQMWQTEPRTAFICSSGHDHERVCKKAVSAGYQVMPYSGEDKVAENIEACYQVGRFFSLSDEQIHAGIARYSPSQHRLDVQTCAGVTLVDDSYNANPSGVLYALQYLRRFKGRKIFVFGDMLELGSVSREQHQRVAEWALNEEVDMLFLVGEEVKAVAEVSSIPAFHFESKDALLALLLDELKEGDVVLFKASRSMRFETLFTEVVHALS